MATTPYYDLAIHLHQYFSPQTVVWARRRRRSLGMLLSCITNRFLLESQHRLLSDSHGLPPVQPILISPISAYGTPRLRSSVADREHRKSAQKSIPTLGVIIARSIRAERLYLQKKIAGCSENATSPGLAVRVFSTTASRIAWVPETLLIRAFWSCVGSCSMRRKPRPSLTVQNYPRLSSVGSIIFRN